MYTLQFNINVAGGCSRRCSGCYSKKNEERMSHEMSIEVAKWIVNMYRKEKVRVMRNYFLGGEPGLNVDAIFDIVDYVKRFKPEYTIGPAEHNGFLVFTNGDLFNGEALRGAKKRGIRFLLNPTYDSLQEVENKFKFVKSICGGCGLSVALNDLNLDRLPDLTRMVVKHGAYMRMNRLYQGGIVPGYVEKYKKQMKKMFEILLKAEKPMFPNITMLSTYFTWPPPKNANTCGKALLVIDPDGTIRTCSADLTTVTGHISTHKNIEDLKFVYRWSAKNLLECKDCEWVTWCQGGCPLARKITYGNVNKRTPYCSAFKELFPLLFKLVRKWRSYVGEDIYKLYSEVI